MSELIDMFRRQGWFATVLIFLAAVGGTIGLITATGSGERHEPMHLRQEPRLQEFHFRGYGVHEVRYKGHVYFYIDGNNDSIIHAEHCECKK